MNRPTLSVAVAMAVAAGGLVAAPAALAAKPAPPGPMSVACSFGVTPTSPTGTGTIGTASNPPRGTRSVYFLFYENEAAASDPWSSGNGGTDFDGRDGWTSWGDPNPVAGWSTNPAYMIVTAYDRKGNTLATVATVCPTP